MAIIVVVALLFAAMGVYALVAPGALLRPFRIRIDKPEARSEVRAVYGGFGLAIAGVLIAAVVDDSLRPGAVFAVAVALAGMAFGRMVSRLVDSATAFYPVWFFCLVELAAAGLLLAAR